MEPGQIVHIVVTVVAILSAGAAALLCDLLRTENARLRQANLVLLAERQEQQRRLVREQEKNLKAVEVVPALLSAEVRSLDAPGHSLDAGSPRRVRIAGSGAVGLMNGHLLSGMDNAGSLTDRGQTLEEARELARNLLASTAKNGRSRPLFDPNGSNGDARATSTNGAGERVLPRRNWGVLLKPPGERSEGAIELGDVGTASVTPG